MQINFKGRENHSNVYKYIIGFVLVFSFFLLFLPNKTYSQYYTTGVENGNIKFRQIKTDRFEIIYPDYYEGKAQEFASALDTIYGFLGNTLKTNPPNVPFILHTNTAFANGLSVWAPKRNELWTTTHPDNEAYPWLWHLALHEWRHSTQVYALNKGTTKILVNLLGEHIYGLVLGVFIPNWFLEGDAVVAETALSPSGRGKTPDFNMYFKAQVLDKAVYDYDRALLGSKKEYIPNEYIFGYNLIGFGRTKYDKYIWADMVENVGRNFWKLQFFGKSEKRGISINAEELYYEMMDSLKTQWEKEDKAYYKNRKDIKPQKLGKNNKYYTSYLSPQSLNDSSIISIKTSSFEPPKLVRLYNNKETDLSYIGRILNSYTDIFNTKLLYSEYKNHPRWEHENYSDIFEYDLETKERNRITYKKRLYTPNYNPNNIDIIAAIEEDSINNQRLVIIDKSTGNIKIRFEERESNDKFSYPTWSDNTNEIFLIRSNHKGKSIGSYNLNSKTYTELIPFTYNNILNTKYHNKRLYFIGDYNNTYQVYSFNPNENTEYIIQNTESRFGVKDFSFIGDSIITSQYTGDGFKIFIGEIEEINKIKKDKKTPILPLAKILTDQEDFIFTKDKIKDSIYPSQKYYKLRHLFNFHSWAPLSISAENQDINFGVSLFSQNILGTSILSGGYKYLVDEKRGEYFMDYTYKGWYPILNIKQKYSQRNISLEEGTNKSRYIFNEYNSGLNIIIPNAWSKNNYNYHFNTIIKYSYRNINPINEYYSNLVSFHTLGIGLRTGTIRTRAINDLSPNLGQTLSLNYQRSITKDRANIFTINTTTYIPSIFPNHSFEINLDYQENTPGTYYFPSETYFTRGIYGESPAKFYGGKLNYHLPLAYPDLAIGKLLYIQRLSARAFFDFGYFDNKYLSSIGTYLQMDFNALRIEYPINIGIQFGYVPQNKDYFANLIFYLNI